MKKKLTALLTVSMMIALFCTGLFSGCSVTDGAPSTATAFVEKIAAKDYAGAYEYIYSFSSDVQSQDDFVDRFTNIYDVLEITDVTLLSQDITQQSENNSRLAYTLQMQSGLLGTLTYDFETDVVAGPLGYNIIYTPSLILPMLEEGDKVRVVSQMGTRGEIFSSDGQLLAKNDYAQSVYIDMEKSPNIDVIKSYLAENYGADADTLQKKYDSALENGLSSTVLMTYPKGTLTEEQKSQIAGVEGLGVDESRMTPARYYPLRDTTSHVIGYLGSPTEEQLAQAEELGITENTQVGASGVEQSLDDTLRGTDGRAIYIEDSRGEQKQLLYEDPKTDGADVHLTIDAELQTRAYTLLAANLTEGQSGVAIAMDYKTGATRAMVSYPSYDNNLFGYTTMKDVLAYYTGEDSNSPLLSRANQATYPPGSAIKPFTAVPAIEAGLITEYGIPPVNIEDDKWVPQMEGWIYPAITTVHTDAGGDLNFENAMRSSNNIYFAYYALQVGFDTFFGYLSSIGFDGEAPTFELPIRASNLINEDTERNLHLIATTAHGGGNILTSPIQFASMYSAFENGGDMVNPTLVESVTQTLDGSEEVLSTGQTTYFKQGTMSDSTIALEKKGMYKVFSEGTAYNANLRNGIVYGKTGTAPFFVDGEKREINWVVAIDPEPESGLLYLVMIETEENIGSDPKLAILHGLVKLEDYNNALSGITSSVTPDEGDTQEGSGPQTSSDPDQGSDPDPSSDPEPSDDPGPSPDPDPDPGDDPES